MVTIRNVKIEDLYELLAIEQLCFSKEEAATLEAFEKRVQKIPDSFFVAEVNGTVIGLVNGPVIETPYITDDLYAEIKSNPATGGHQTILGVAVRPLYQKRGIASLLLKHLEQDARSKNRETVTLTCKKDLLGFYENHGYRNDGVSSSEHGGVTWYNMVKSL